MSPDTMGETTQHSGSKTTFFRQSSWMMFATIASGACMFGVHFFSKKIPDSEYGIFGTMLSVLNCMGIPAVALQMVFAHQAADAVSEEQHRQLVGTTRAIWLATTALWVVALLIVAIGHQYIFDWFKLTNPWCLWITLVAGLGSLWQPIFGGLLQGYQRFLWLGGSSILAGAGRLLSVAIIVLVFQGYATGMMTGAALGIGAALAMLLWHTRDIWRGPAAPFDLRGWLKRVIPLTFGFGASQFMLSADPIFVQKYFTETHPYMAAGTLARALIVFTSPLAAVMFPKVVRSIARAEKSDVMLVALATTGALVGLAAIGLAVIGPWLLPIVFKKSFSAAGELLPAFALSMVPLALANVLVNNLLARQCFVAVPWLVLVAVGYAICLTFFHDSFLTIIRILGTANLVFLGVAAGFTWLRGPSPAQRQQ